MGGVGTSMVGSSAMVPQNLGKFEEMHGGTGEVNISASIRTPCNKFFCSLPERHRNISRILWAGVDQHPLLEQVVSKKPAMLRRCMGERGGEYL